MTFTPTPEQLAIVDFAKTRPESLLITALAGCAKTTTLELVCKKIDSIPILSLAFNKRIQEEMEKRLPGHVQTRTFNGLGHRVWASATGRKLVINSKKSFELLSAELAALPPRQRSAAYADFADLLKAVNQAKLVGYIPEDSWPEANHLISAPAFLDSFDDDISHHIRLIDRVLNASIAAAYEGSIDFSDQIYMPTLFGGSFPQFPLVLVDEAQDLSPLNHAMLRKLVSKRLIAVGDPFQSIYGFRGAVSNGMDSLRTQFKMHSLPLNITFRCPRAIVERARSRAPDMQYPEWAAEGHVETMASWVPADIPDNAAIICSNNAPLFRAALLLIRNRRRVKLVGADVGPALVKVLKKFGPPEMTQAQVLVAIDDWLEELLRRPKGKTAAYDRAECLRVFANSSSTLGGAIAFAEDLFKQDGPIQLLSGHKSKGLEWDTVFHLDPQRIPSPWAEDLEQELNVRYVIETRAKDKLYLIEMDGFSA